MTDATETRFKIPAANVASLVAKIEKLNKRAAKLGCPAIRCEVGETFEVEEEIVHELLGPTGVKKIRRYAWAEVEGPAPKLNGYTFVATLEHTEAGNIVRTVPTETIPTEFQIRPQFCDHCKQNRFRRDTYVVRHEDGAHQQVGSGCLRDFLGHKSPEAIARWSTYLATLRGELEDEFGGYPDHAPDLFDTDYVFTAAAAAIRQHGWVSRKSADEFGRRATAGRVSDEILWKPGTKGYTESRLNPTDEDKARGNRARQWILDNLTGELNEYKNNLKVVASRKGLATRDFGIAASAISFVERELGIIAEQQKQRESKSNEHISAVGQRIASDLTLISVREIGRDAYTRWDAGISYLYKFEDAAGNSFSWFSSNKHDLTNGQTYKVTGTVKAHKEYKGRNETQLTRCKIA